MIVYNNYGCFLVFRVDGAVDVFSLEKSFKDLLSELRQTQTPLAFEADTTDNLMRRPDPRLFRSEFCTTTRNSPTLCLDRLRRK